jgi:hypothetical protein
MFSGEALRDKPQYRPFQIDKTAASCDDGDVLSPT